MLKKTYSFLLLLLALALIIALLGFAFYFSRQASKTLDQAEESYKNGVSATNLIDRQAYFNTALRYYLSLEEKYTPNHGNGKLYNNIAETYYQLEDYPRASYYFYQTKSLSPRSQLIEDRLQETLDKAGIKDNQTESVFEPVFFFHYYLSLPERLIILAAITALIFILTSIYIWKEYDYIKGIIAQCLLVASLFLGSVLYTKYVESLEAVVLEPTMLYSNAKEQSAFVEQAPLQAGKKIAILDVLEDGKWVKVRFNEAVGFIPSEKVGVIKI